MSGMDLIVEAMRLYNDPRRGYHNFAHVQYCLEQLSGCENHIKDTE